MGIPDQGWETADFVLDAGERAGFGRSRSRLQHWHQQEIVGRPAVRPRVGVRGRETVYPPRTSAQYVRALEIHRSVRLLDRVRWILWFEGWPIEIALVRRRLEAFAGALDEVMSKMLTSDGQFSEEFEDYLDEVGERDIDMPVARAIRRRVGADQFGDFLGLMVLRQTGHRDLTDDELALLDHGFGDDSARSEDFLGGAPFKEGYEDDDWTDLEPYFGGRSLRDDVIALADEDLINAREILKRLLAISSDMGSTLKTMSQPWAGGVALHSSYAKTFNEDADHQTSLTTSLAVFLANPSERHWIDEFLQIPVDYREPEHLRWKFLQRLGSEIPDFDFLLDTKRYRRALRDPKEKQKLKVDFLYVLENNRTEFERVAEQYHEETGLTIIISSDAVNEEGSKP